MAALLAFAPGIAFAVSGDGATPLPPRRPAVPASSPETPGATAYDIPSGELTSALTRWAEVSSRQLLAPSDLVRGLRCEGLTGTYAPEGALRTLLVGTGLDYRAAGVEAVAIINPQYAQLRGASTDVTLEELSVVGQGPSSSSGQPPPTGLVGQPPAPYAGGQVGSGTRVGLLGNQGVFNTPFNVTGYTDRLIRDQQSRAIADVVLNDPSVQLATPRGGPQDQFVIRGFRTLQQDILFDGLGGLVDLRRPAIDNVERVEILKGPTALLNGVTVNGSIGGLITFIPKRATDEPITRYTLGYASRAEFGNYLDVGRRFGPNNE